LTVSSLLAEFHEKTDFVISQTKLVAMAPASNFGAPPPAALVDIEGFKFGPAKLQVPKGMPIRWTNKDDSPHQVTVPGPSMRSPVIAKGEPNTQTFAAPGTYDYLCASHPNMKGQIEVK
jgi:plastocyanin